MNETALSRALGKPHIAAELERRQTEAALSLDTLKGMAKASAFRVGLDLMHNSPDHKVRAKMVELFAGEARQALVNVNLSPAHEPATGYRYARPSDSPSVVEDAQVVDVQAQSTDVDEDGPSTGK